MVRKADESENLPEREERLIERPGARRRPKEEAAGEGDVEGLAENAEPGAVHKQEELSQESRPRLGIDAPPGAAPRGRAKPPSAWTDRELREQRRKLVERRQQLREDMHRLRGDAISDSPGERGETTGFPMHLADAATEAFDQARDLALAEQQGEEIQQIDRAIDRLEAGTYGVCDECGRPIGKDRLLAIPHAQFCYDCQTQREAE